MDNTFKGNQVTISQKGVAPMQQNPAKDVSYTYESPLSILDTIQTVNNLISGSTRNFAKLRQHLTARQQSFLPAEDGMTLQPSLLNNEDEK